MHKLLLTVAALIIAAPVLAEVNVGDPAPDFSATADSGETWKLADHIGKQQIVVYFYPAAMTGGCTAQACGYRDAQADLAKHNAVVVGVSGDRVDNLKWFKQAEHLNFPLLSDAGGTVARAFGVPTRGGGTIQREVGGATHDLVRDLSAARWTFVIGLDGTIKHKDTSVSAAADSARVLEILAR